MTLPDLPTLVAGGVLWHCAVKAARALRSCRARPDAPRDLFLPGDVVVARVLITIPKAATRADVSDWLNLMVAGIGSMRMDNALHECEVEAHALAWSVATEDSNAV